MPKLNLKCSAEGTHEAYDGDNKVGEIENDHLYQYAAKHAGKDGACVQGNLSARGAGFESANVESYATFASEVGAEGRSKEEIRGLVTLALHPLKAEVTLLSEAIGADGKLDNSRLDALDDSGKISRSAWRRAKDAEQRVQTAFNRGQITPGHDGHRRAAASGAFRRPGLQSTHRRPARRWSKPTPSSASAARARKPANHPASSSRAWWKRKNSNSCRPTCAWANWKPIARPAPWWRKKIPTC